MSAFRACWARIRYPRKGSKGRLVPEHFQRPSGWAGVEDARAKDVILPPHPALGIPDTDIPIAPLTNVSGIERGGLPSPNQVQLPPLCLRSRTARAAILVTDPDNVYSRVDACGGYSPGIEERPGVYRVHKGSCLAFASRSSAQAVLVCAARNAPPVSSHG